MYESLSFSFFFEMKDYILVDLIGEGSFGRVFKAKTKKTGEIVALKAILKVGRTPKELISLSKEYQIQQNLNHPNIIHMIESFEDDNHIFVVTEFAHKDLHHKLCQEGRIIEEEAKRIIFDLLSALHYLHSQRILHRDLKPQNVLLCKNGKKIVAKLCDFGLARNMSTETHVLTSIKGTPLYMAPEILEESPYDHAADLWSLGCIIYEILVGKPPFMEKNLFQLVHKIKTEPIRWPEDTSFDCHSLLKGLLDKDPKKRLKWPQLLELPFVKDNIYISDANDVSTPLTAELTSSQVKAKELQKQDIANNKKKIQKELDKNVEDVENEFRKLKLVKQKECAKLEEDLKKLLNVGSSDPHSEPDEWIKFLKETMEEIMEGDIQSIRSPPCLNMVCRALGSNSAQVVDCIAKIFILPFTIDDIDEIELYNLRKVYFETNLIKKLIYACVILTKRTDEMNNLSTEQLDALETIYLLIVNLVYVDVKFLKQLCENCNTLSLSSHLVFLLSLKKRNVQIAENVVAILCQILRGCREYSFIVTDFIKGLESPDVEFQRMLTLNTECLSLRTLALIKLMLSACPNTLHLLCPESLEKDLESLTKNSNENINVMATEVLEEIKRIKNNVRARAS